MSDENTTAENDDNESPEDDDAQRQLAEASESEGDDDSGQGEKSDGKDYKSEADRWKSQSRKNETELRAAQKKLREIEDKDKSEAQKLADQLKERDDELTELRVAQMRRDAAEAANLPASFTKFISASDPDEALAQAKELAKAVVKATDNSEPPKQQSKTDFRQGVRGSAPKPTGDKNELIRRMAGFS